MEMCPGKPGCFGLQACLSVRRLRGGVNISGTAVAKPKVAKTGRFKHHAKRTHRRSTADETRGLPPQWATTPIRSRSRFEGDASQRGAPSGPWLILSQHLTAVAGCFYTRMMAEPAIAKPEAQRAYYRRIREACRAQCNA